MRLFKRQDICSQCKKEIKKGDKLFIDSFGEKKRFGISLSLKEVVYYHYDCIISEKGPEKDDKVINL